MDARRRLRINRAKSGIYWKNDEAYASNSSNIHSNEGDVELCRARSCQEVDSSMSKNSCGSNKF